MLSISIDLVAPHWLLVGDGMAWTAYPLTFANFTAAAGSQSITLAALPAKTVVHAVAIKHSTAFGGGAISVYNLQVGISGVLNKYASAFNVFQAPGDTVGQFTTSGNVENFASPVNLLVTATCGGGTLNTATQGAVTIWVLTSVLP